MGKFNWKYAIIPALLTVVFSVVSVGCGSSSTSTGSGTGGGTGGGTSTSTVKVSGSISVQSTGTSSTSHAGYSPRQASGGKVIFLEQTDEGTKDLGISADVSSTGTYTADVPKDKLVICRYVYDSGDTAIVQDAAIVTSTTETEIKAPISPATHASAAAVLSDTTITKLLGKVAKQLALSGATKELAAAIMETVKDVVVAVAELIQDKLKSGEMSAQKIDTTISKKDLGLGAGQTIEAAMKSKRVDEIHGKGELLEINRMKRSDQDMADLTGGLERSLQSNVGSANDKEKYLRDLFLELTGSTPPGDMLDAFVTAMNENFTRTVEQLLDAFDLSLDKTAYLSSLNTSLQTAVSDLAKLKLGQARSKRIGPNMIGLLKRIQALLPLTLTTTIDLPIGFVVADGVFQQHGDKINPYKFMKKLGLKLKEVTGGVTSGGIRIVHHELRAVSYMEWGDNPQDNLKDSTKRTDSMKRALFSMVEVINESDFGDQLSNYSAKLTYTNKVGGTSTIAYKKQTFGPPQSQPSQVDGQFQGPPGFHGMIDPWGGPNGPDSAVRVTDFASGPYTINVYEGSNTTAKLTQSGTFTDVDLSGVKMTWVSPGQSFDPSSATKYEKGKPVSFEWSIDTTGVTLPSGVVLKVGLRLFKESNQPCQPGQPCGGGPVYESMWFGPQGLLDVEAGGAALVLEKIYTQPPFGPPGSQSESNMTAFTDGTYRAEGFTVAMAEDGMMVSDGPPSPSYFTIGEGTTNVEYALSGTITAPTTPPTGTLSVGVFIMPPPPEFDPSSGKFATFADPTLVKKGTVSADNMWSITLTPKECDTAAKAASLNGNFYPMEIRAWYDADSDGALDSSEQFRDAAIGIDRDPFGLGYHSRDTFEGGPLPTMKDGITINFKSIVVAGPGFLPPQVGPGFISPGTN